jgi:tripartite-type tricarboxylate transporter receptor subunit TctC
MLIGRAHISIFLLVWLFVADPAAGGGRSWHFFARASPHKYSIDAFTFISIAQRKAARVCKHTERGFCICMCVCYSSSFLLTDSDAAYQNTARLTFDVSKLQDARFVESAERASV